MGGRCDQQWLCWLMRPRLFSVARGNQNGGVSQRPKGVALAEVTAYPGSASAGNANGSSASGLSLTAGSSGGGTS